MKICFFLERGSPPRVNPVIAETAERLTASGAEVQMSHPEEELIRIDTLSVNADLYLLKSDTELSLSLALALERLGAQVINPVKGCILAKDKILASAVLANAAIPAPRAFAASEPAQLAVAFSGGPAIFKPHRGYHGVGITIAGDRDSFPDAEVYPDVAFAESYLANARRDLKIFGIGEKIFGVRKAFSETSFVETGVACDLPPGAEELARRCADAFGLRLYGIDIAEDESGLHVLDVNYFPGYRGVPDAARHLAAYILSALAGKG